jgi:RNA-directed DNA polymerase
MNNRLLNDLFQAYYDARKNKRSTINALAFEIDYESKLFELCEEIKSGKYEIGRSVCFVSFEPVQREVFAADFRDRIVHHLIYNYINPYYERLFINDSYSCRAGKGTSYGIERADYFIRSCSQNYKKDCWILKMDIKGYFMAMDRNIVFEKVEKTLNRFRQEAKFDFDLVLRLIRKVVFHDPTKNCVIRGTRSDWNGLPKSKSLFFAGKDKGFPIGNLTSQLFGNIYLNELDYFVKYKLGFQYYGRYVDDFLLSIRIRNILSPQFRY